MWKLQNFLSFTSIKNGSIIIAWFTLIRFILASLLSIPYMTLSHNDYKIIFEKVFKHYNISDIDSNIYALIIKDYFIFNFITDIIIIIISILLLIGINKNKPTFMVPFIFYQVFIIILLPFIIITIFIFCIYNTKIIITEIIICIFLSIVIL